MRRLFLLLIVALMLAPGTWVRTPLRGQPVDNRQVLTFTPLAVPQRGWGEMTLAGAWRLDSPNWHFHGFSALVTMGDGSLLAVSDGGRMMRFRPREHSARPQFGFFAELGKGDKRLADAEAVTRDPATGTLWTAYEMKNLIERYDASLVPTGRVRPAAMRSWSTNTGPEAMARLPDGRFLVLSEGNPRWFASGIPGLLFAGDPVEGSAPTAFEFAPPEGFRPVDMTALPDGRVLILLREVKWGLPPGFVSRVMVADPREIRPGEVWRGRTIAEIAKPLPAENYEGVAVEPAADGSIVVWLIADDNHAMFQRTLLLELAWRANEKARGSPRAPR